MLPFDGNLTAALAAFSVATSAFETHTYTDMATVRMHDTVFATSTSASCYVGACANNNNGRTIRSKKEIKRMLLTELPDAFGVHADTLSAPMQAYFETCRSAVHTILFENATTKVKDLNNADLTARVDTMGRYCNVQDALGKAVDAFRGAEDMKNVLAYRLQYVLEDIAEFELAAQHVNSQARGSGMHRLV